jgi:phosphoglycerol transferase MdoB-like AlkP superfamily enzyme
LNPHSPWNGVLPLELRCNFLAGEIALLSIVLVPLAVLARLLLALRGSGFRRVTVVLLFLLCVAFLLMSWGQALNTTYFARSGSMQMLATNPVALLQHAVHFHPLATALLPLAVASLAGAAAWIVLRRWPAAHPRRAPLLACVVFLLIGAGYFRSIPWSMLPFQVKNPFNNPGTGQVSTLGDYLTELYTRKNGPLTTLVAERMLAKAQTLLVDESIPVVRRSIVSLEEYAAGVDAASLRRHNVLLIQVESLRVDELFNSVSGVEVMPNLNRLARESDVFLENYATSTHSNYVDLVPLSSHYPLRSPQTHDYPQNPTYPRVLIYDVLKQFGYHTAVISSQNENWGQMINYLSTDGLDDLLHSDNFDGDTYVPRNDIGFFSMSKKSGKVDDRYTIDRMIGWIQAHRDAPFCICSNLQSSHFPFEVGADFTRPFGPATIDFEPLFNRLEPAQVPIMRARFRDSLAYIDAQLGRLFEFLQREKLWDNTIVVITGDNGEAFMEHGFSGHANRLFNESLKVPLVVRVPDRAAGVSGRVAQHIDIPPTILGAIGLPKHPSFQGIDLFQERENVRDVFLVVQSPFAEQYGIVRDGFKYAYEPFYDRALLFDLKSDPQERRNLVTSNPGLAEQLRRRLDTWRHHQLTYYNREDLHLVTYPPVLGDAPPPAQVSRSDATP